MAESVLQKFLNQQFIKTADGANIESLKKAVTSLTNNLAKNKKLVIPYTLVALDPQIPETDPVVTAVENIIIKNWSTFKNNTSTEDKATTYVRVVILQALSELAKDEQMGAIIWLTGRNVISYYKTQKEKQLISQLLIDMGSKFELVSRGYWSLSELTISEVRQLGIDITPSKSSLIDEKTLTAELKAAAIHSGWKTEGGGGENPSYSSISDWKWSKFFSERAGAGFTKVINTAISGQDKVLTSFVTTLQKGIDEYFAQFKPFFENASSAMNQSFAASSKRGDLLWWKQTLYSPVLNSSYRLQNDVTSALTMAFDLSNLLGLMYPESANYLLREALRDVYGEAMEKPETFEFWMNKMLAISGSGLASLTSLINNSEGRKPLGVALANALQTNSIEGFQNQTGIEPTQEVSLADLSVWILHDLQAAKFSIQK